MQKKYWLTGLIFILIALAGIWSFYPQQSNSKKGNIITLASSPGPYRSSF
ncbi:hypothetical protein [Fructobacillus tropaeoli]|uniref:Uncharacterized protein n=1 Tax=Fructobacillus tropaeoli TaxID=709323 RepID=A0A3F3GXX6_9LACO|nr:hypothetical protein [Fructobacillus tropaeoli]GAP03466.1 hypothetical protein FTRO_0010080 [Fructobacillus tropaeoli]